MLRRVGHKGADSIAPGNTPASYAAAVEAGVDMIEFDVVRPPSDFADGNWRAAAAGPATGEPLLNAHDWPDARRRDPLTFAEALDAFTEPPLETVEIDVDLKLAGREDEVVAALRRARPDVAGDDLDDGAVEPRRAPRSRPGAAPRLDLPEEHARLDGVAARQGDRRQRAAADAPAAAAGRGPRPCRSSGSRRCGCSTP